MLRRSKLAVNGTCERARRPFHAEFRQAVQQGPSSWRDLIRGAACKVEPPVRFHPHWRPNATNQPEL